MHRVAPQETRQDLMSEQGDFANSFGRAARSDQARYPLLPSPEGVADATKWTRLAGAHENAFGAHAAGPAARKWGTR